MKNVILAIVFLFSGIVMSQENKPTFEKQNDAIKGTYYHTNGKISQEGFYNKEGKLHGEWKAYNVEGKKIALGQYENGLKVGKWFFWKEKELSEVNYTNNAITSVTNWSNKNDVVLNYKSN